MILDSLYSGQSTFYICLHEFIVNTYSSEAEKNSVSLARQAVCLLKWIYTASGPPRGPEKPFTANVTVQYLKRFTEKLTKF